MARCCREKDSKDKYVVGFLFIIAEVGGYV